MLKLDLKIKIKEVILIVLGVVFYIFGFVKFNMVNYLVEGGIFGVILIIYVFFGVNLVFLLFFFNILLFILGVRILGKKFLLLIIYGIVLMFFFMWFW